MNEINELLNRLSTIRRSQDEVSPLVGRLLTASETETVGGGGYAQTGGTYTMSGGDFSQSGGYYSQSGGSYTMKGVLVQ